MIRKLIIIIIIVAAAGGAAYYFGFFKPSVNKTIEDGIDKVLDTTKDVVETIKNKAK